MLRSLGKTGLEIAPLVFGGMFSGGRSTRRLASRYSTPSSIMASTSLTPPTSIRPGGLATRVENPKRLLASG